MSEALHIFRKDMRRLWPAVAGSAVIMGLGYLLTVSNVDPTFHFMSSDADKLRKGLLEAGWAVGPFLLAVWVVQQDLLVNDRAVWLTRPIGAREIFLAKFLFFGAAIAAPVAVVSFLAALWLRAPVTVAAVSGVENAGIALLAAFLAAAIASITGSTKGALLALGAVLGGWVAAGFIAIRFHLSLPDGGTHSAATEVVVGLGLTLAALAMAAGHQYATRRTGRTVLLGIVLYVAAVVGAVYWPLELVRSVAPLAATGSEAVRVEADSSGVVFAPRQTSSGAEVDVWVPFVLGGQAADRTFVLQGIEPRLELGDGSTVRTVVSQGFEPGILSNYGQTLMNDRRAMLAALGMGAADGATRAPQRVAAFAMPAAAYGDAQGKSGRLDLGLHLTEMHYVIVARLPVVSGAESRSNGQLWRIRSIEYAMAGGFDLELQFARVESILARPGQWTARNYTRPGYILVNAERREFSVADRLRLSGVSGATISLRADRPGFETTYDCQTDQRRGAVDSMWLAGAELCVFEAEPVGEMVKEVHVAPFVIGAPNGAGR
jgi:hypothetical protein